MVPAGAYLRAIRKAWRTKSSPTTLVQLLARSTLPLAATQQPPPSAGPGLVLYDDALASDWEDWSWGAQPDFAHTATVKVGRYATRVDFKPWGGLSLRHASGMAATPATRLDFWAYAAQTTELRVSVQAPPSQQALSQLWRQVIGESSFVPTVRQSGFQSLSTY